MSLHHLTEPSPPRRVVILGGSGFVGTHLASSLRAMAIPAVSLSSADIDLSDKYAAERLSYILESGDSLVVAAAITPDRGNDISALMRNLAMAETISLSSPPALAQVIYVSSDAVYNPRESVVRETTIPAPSDLYGHMHYVREQMFTSLSRKWQCPLLVIRPCAIYGAGDTHNSYGPNRFLRTAVQKQPIALFGHGEELRDHLFIDDFCQLLTLCLLCRSTGLLNAATGLSISFFDLATAICRVSNESIFLEHRPRTNLITHRHFDTSELIRSFPTFHFTPLSEGLRTTRESIIRTMPALVH